MDSVLEIECGFYNDYKDIKLLIYFPYLLFQDQFLIYSCIPTYLPRKKRYNPIYLFATGRCPQMLFSTIYNNQQQQLPPLMRKQKYKISERILNLFLEGRNIIDLIAELKEERLN